jgi:hypothetical protein
MRRLFIKFASFVPIVLLVAAVTGRSTRRGSTERIFSIRLAIAMKAR